jgi:hypothetical protein
MLKVAIIGKSKKKIIKLKSILRLYDLEYSEDAPDFVISYGGDGMFLISERIFPFVPKILMRDSKLCNNCTNLSPEEIIEKLSKKDYVIEEIIKIKAVVETSSGLRELIGVNDVVIRNFLPTSAIRFQYKINEGEYSSELVGDGIVIATPFGSNKGAYFHSITKTSVKDKIGIAFNNTTIHHHNKIIEINDKIEIKLNRGDPILVSDNNHDYIPLSKESIVQIELHTSKARIVKF